MNNDERYLQYKLRIHVRILYSGEQLADKMMLLKHPNSRFAAWWGFRREITKQKYLHSRAWHEREQSRKYVWIHYKEGGGLPTFLKTLVDTYSLTPMITESNTSSVTHEERNPQLFSDRRVSPILKSVNSIILVFTKKKTWGHFSLYDWTCVM